MTDLIPLPVTADPPDTDEELVVLHSLRPPDGTTKYVDHMVGSAAPGIALRFFSWRVALFTGYDVLHVHWPELLIRDSRRPWMRVVKRRLLDLLLLRLWLWRIPLIWTVHNLEPHETITAAERRSLSRFSRRVDLVIRLHATSPVTAGQETVTIPHGHYRLPFVEHPKAEAEPGRVLYFGLIRPYKGVDTLITAFESVARDDVQLRIVGHPHPGQAEVVQRACVRDPRISCRLAFVDDRELVDEISRSQLVVLPYRGGMHSSGALIAALSLGRPVLVPESPTNAALAEEAGRGWIRTYSGSLTAAVLEAAIDATAVPPTGAPRLDERDWHRVGLRHREAYRLARSLRGRG